MFQNGLIQCIHLYGGIISERQDKEVAWAITPKMNISELERLKKQVHDWWQDKENSM